MGAVYREELSANARKLIKQLLSLPQGWVTAAALAESIGVSRRTVLRELPAVEQWMQAAGAHFVRNPGKGLLLDEAPERRDALRTQLNSGDRKKLSRAERRQQLLTRLLSEQEPCKTAVLARALGVSESTLSADLDELETKLHPYRVEMFRRPGVGVWLQGDASSYRRVVSALLRSSMPEKELAEVLCGRMPENEIFSTLSLIPTRPTMEGYKAAMNNYGGDINIWQAMLNTYKYVIPKVIFTVVSSTITAYGFGRFRFRGRNFLFAVLMATLFLPQVVLNIPQFLMYRQFGWVDSPYYLALIVPTLFAQETYFVYMLIQFMRNIPRELDEAAKIDGCNIMQTLVLVLVPMLWPAMVSAGLFQFMWSSNDFMGPLLYVNSPARYPATLFVRMSMDADTGFAWNRVMAVSLISIIPSLVVFFLAQRQFMDGVTAGAVKG